MSPLYPALVSFKKDTGLTERDAAGAVRQRFAARARRFRGTAPAPTLSRTYVVEVAGTVDQALSSLRADPEVEYAEKDKVVSVGLTPNDPYFSSTGTWGQAYDDLWGLKKIGAAAAWDTTAGQGVIVAVSDTGVDYAHPDLANNIWTNAAEIPGNAIDDDGNGYVDDTRGWDFVSRDNDPRDGHGHGTHVAGTIAAEGDNGVGVIGVAYRATIMPVRGLDNTGNGWDSDLAATITYAANNGADVINASWGGFGTSQTIANAVTYAHSLGVVVVVAAGNEGADARNYYPAGLANVVTVAATASNDTTASFSNWGPRIDVSAPGVDILSLAGAGTAMGTLVAPGYTRANGTSMAAPHAAGLAALVLAQHPAYSNEEVRQVLRVSALDLGGPGIDPAHGYGRVRAAAALAVPGVLEAKIFAPVDGTRLTGPTPVSGVARGTGFVHYVLAYGAGSSPSVWTTIQDSSVPATGGALGTVDPAPLADGLYTLRLTAYDISGASFIDQIQVDVDNLSITNPPTATVPSTAGVFKPGVAIPVTGTAIAPGLQFFHLEWAPGINPASGWSTQGVVLAGGGTSPVTSGPLGTWTTPAVSQADYYTLRLVVQGASSTSETRTLVYLEPDLLNANWPKWLDQGPNSRSGAVPALDAQGNFRLEVVNPPYLSTPLPSRLWTFLPDGSAPTTTDLYYGSYANPATGNVDGIPGDETVVAEPWNMRVVRQDGTTYMLTPTVNGVNFQHAVVLIEDLDGDGASEVLAVGSSWSNQKAYVFAWKANGMQAGPAFPLEIEDRHDDLVTWSREPRVFVADLDGTGGKEILAVEGVSPTSYRVRVFGADGSPRASMPTISGAVLHQVALADFEGDGQLETVLVGLDGQENFVHVFEPDGTQRPGWPQSLVYPGTSSMAIADLDRDGRSEVIVLNWSVLYVFKADGTSFSPAWPRFESTNNAFSGLTVADVDGDGYPDILVTQQFTPPTPSGFEAAAAAALPEADAATAQRVGPDAEVRSRAMADGSVATGTFVTPAASAAAATYNEPKLLVFGRDGTITRSWRLLGAQGDQPHYQSTLTVGDFNRDGGTDIAVSYQTIDGGGQGGWLNEGILTILDTRAGRTVLSDWPMVYHDARNTSRLGATASSGPPTIVITSPANGAVVTGVVGVSVSVTNDAPILAVQYFLDGSVWGPEVTAFPYSTTLNTAALTLGPHSVRAVMRDALGRLTWSAPVDVTVADLTPPSTSIVFPFPGITQAGQAFATIEATDERGMVTLIELYVDGVKRASAPGGPSTASPFVLQWNTALEGDGPHNLQARAYDAAGNVGLSPVVGVTTQNGRASYDPARKAPVCPLIGTTCDSGTLLNGRAGLGPEVNQPNTINATCADGTAGSYHVDPSIDAIRVVSLDGRPLRYGSMARIEVTVWSRTPSSERLDLYYTTNTVNPVWTFLRTIIPPGGSPGSRVLTTTHVLPVGGMQALRAQYRNLGVPTPCTTGTLNDHDDLVFAVKPNAAPTARANGPYQGKTGDVITFSSAGSSDPDGDPLTYVWSFGDGTTSTLANPTHVYSSAFNYTAQLTVRDGAYTSPASSASVAITAPPSLEVFIQGHHGGSGTVSIAPPGETCANAPGGSQLCNYSYPETTTVTLTAVPAADSTFAGWAGDCSGTGPCQIAVNSLFSVQATFDGPAPAEAPLDVQVVGTEGGQGVVMVTPPGTTCANTPGTSQLCTTSQPVGEIVNLVATPGPDSVFVGWTGACTGVDSCNVPIAEYQMVTATFRGPQPLDVFVTGVEGGSGVVRITPPNTTCANVPGSSQLCTTTHRVGTLVLLDPTPAPDSVFVGWTGACTGVGSCTVPVESYQQVTATFRGPQPLDVFVTGVEGGSGVVGITPPNTTCANVPGSSQLCTTTHRVGTLVLLDPTPAPDSVFVGWTGACTGVGSCTVPMESYQQVTATFRGPQPLDVFVNGVEGGSGVVRATPPNTTCANVPGSSQLCTTTHRVGTLVLLDPTPAPDSVFVGWTGACTGVGSCTVPMESYQQVTATFRGPQPLDVFVTGVEGGSGVVRITPPNTTCANMPGSGQLCTTAHQVGTMVQLDPTPAPDSVFVGWAGACTGVGSCTVPMESHQQVTATFRGPQTLEVVVTGVEGGLGAVNVSPPNVACANGAGTTQTCASLHQVGTVVTLDALPGAESVFVGWSGACTNPTGPCLVSMDAAHAVTATFRGPQTLEVVVTGVEGGLGAVNVSPPNVACANAAGTTQTCASLHQVGTVVTLDALAGAESVFIGWSGACTNPTGPCLVSMDMAHTVTARFRGPQTLEVVVTGVDGGMGAVNVSPPNVACVNGPGTTQTCASLHQVGTVVTLDALPGAESVFIGWSGACTNPTGPCLVSMDMAHTVTARFRGPQTLEVVVTGVEGGLGAVNVSPPNIACANGPGTTQTCASLHQVGTVVTLDALPGAESVFVGWSGACTNPTGPCLVSMDAAHAVTATFRGIQLVVGVDSIENGSGSVNSTPPGAVCSNTPGQLQTCTYPYPPGTVVTLVAVPASGSVFVGWSGACAGLAECQVTLDGTQLATATFRGPQRLGVTVESAASGSGRVDYYLGPLLCANTPGTSNTCEALHAPGTQVILVPVASPDSAFTGWSGECAGSAFCTVTLDQARNVTATFRGPHTLTLILRGTEGARGHVGTCELDGSPEVTCTSLHAPGSTVGLPAQPEPGSVFVGWTGCVATSVCLLPMDQDHTVIATFRVNHAPVANAGGPYTGVRGAVVAFDGTGSSDADGDALIYSWDFGDGATGFGPTPSHTYAAVGNYTVTLVVEDGRTSSPAATTTVAIANRPPVANAGGPYTGVRGQAIAFDGSGSSDPDSDPLTFAWDFGDGSTGTGATPTHVYASLGTFTATLTVGDGHTTAGATASVTITNRAPTASAGGPYTGVRGQAIAFDGSASSDPDGDALTFAWDFGDGSTGTGATPTHVYASLGTFTARLVVSDATTSSAPAFASVTIDNRAPVANPGGPYSGVRGTAVALSGAASSDPDGDPLTYRWTFGDGGTSTLAAPGHTYTTVGTFTVTLIVNDGHVDSAPATTTVTIANRAPTAQPGGPYAGLRGVAVAFNGSTSSDPDGDPLTYTWAFGDGSTGTGPTPTHAYATLGTFTVTLVVNDGFTSSPPATTTVTVSNRPPIANAGPNRTVVRRTIVTLDGRASSDPDGTITAYAWRQLSGPTVSITNANTSQPRFTAPNVSSSTNLTFELKVTDNNGATATDTIVVTVIR
jgi:subtilisin family serine protease/PKD repeat protein